MEKIDIVIFGIKLSLKPIAFTLPFGDGWNVYWYGIIIALGFLLAVIYAIKNAQRYGLNTDRMLDVALVTTPVAILCARAYYVIFDGEKLESIGDFFGFGNSQGFSGLAIYGGVIGAFITGALMCKLRKVNILNMFDIAAVGFIIGQGIGRWGNFVNQEAYGSFTKSSWWGMESDRTIYEMGEGLVHPCFLYESVWCAIGFFLLHKISKKRKFGGQIFLSYCAWYGFGRAFIELLRTDSLMLGNIKVSSLLSFLLCITAVVLLFVLNRKVKESEHDDDYGDMFANEEAAEAVLETANEVEEIEIIAEQEENENDQDN